MKNWNKRGQKGEGTGREEKWSQDERSREAAGQQGVGRKEQKIEGTSREGEQSQGERGKEAGQQGVEERVRKVRELAEKGNGVRVKEVGKQDSRVWRKGTERRGN